MNLNFKHASLTAMALITSLPLAAHHSFYAEFDEHKPVTLTGKLTDMKWSNPHGWLYLDVTEADGKVVNWAFELSSTNAMIRRGWRKDDLPTGVTLVINAYQARNGRPVAYAEKIILPDGRQLFQGSPGSSESSK